MTLDQLKQYAISNNVKLKGTGKKEVHVAKLQKSWPFPSTLEGFIGRPAEKGIPYHRVSFFFDHLQILYHPSMAFIPSTLTWWTDSTGFSISCTTLTSRCTLVL
jgi:hypothetical protein